ncbi:MAG: 3-phosphoshikimate 1-carboxyvinyltransferase [Mariniblastus sp.]
MPDYIEVKPVSSPVNSTIQPPGSKSLTNRALPIAAMARGRSTLTGVLDSDDTKVMIESLEKIGVTISHDKSKHNVIVDGVGGQFKNEPADLFIGNSGTTIRFLTAMLGFAGGEYCLDGIPRMRERPIGPLVDALNRLGADVVAQSAGGCPPVKIKSPRLTGGSVSIRGDVSSQYLSGLMMAASQASGDVAIEIDGPLISKPYVEMTRRVMKDFGVECQISQGFDQFKIVGGQNYSATKYQIEPDASAASYFWAAAAICGGTATVKNLNRNSLQGDVRFVECLELMGCEVNWGENEISVSGPAKIGIDIDMSDVSDTVQTLAAVALFVEGTTVVRNVAHNRVKETDRIGNLAIELRKFGVKVDEHEDGLTIHPGPLNGADIETYDDHRMAMSLALVGLKQSGVKIHEPGCVSKTYPHYFDDLQKFVS